MNELQHHGVKGMKWGVRRAKKKAERAANKEQEKAAKQKKFEKIGRNVLQIAMAVNTNL